MREVLTPASPRKASAPLFAGKLLGRTAEIAGAATRPRWCKRTCYGRAGSRNAGILAVHCQRVTIDLTCGGSCIRGRRRDGHRIHSLTGLSENFGSERRTTLAREREPIERVRARLEALVMANAASRCGARSKRTGKPCRAAAMPNGRCKVHGGKSTGPRTPEGLQRSRRANWKHGYYAREAKAERSRAGGNTCAPLSTQLNLRL
jgi:hypothetical protein